MLGKWAVKDHYLQIVEGRVGSAIHLKQGEPLQQIMAAALDLAASKRAVVANPSTTSNLPRVQNPDRIKCPKCSWWHHKDSPCRRVEGNRRGAPRPRIQEAELHPVSEVEDAIVEEAAYSDAPEGGQSQSDQEGF